MRKLCCVLCLGGLALVGVPSLRSDEKQDPKTLIDRAIRAIGGAEKLAKVPAEELKGKGTYYGLGDKGVPFTGEWAFHLPKQMRFSIESNLGGKGFKMTQVVNGDKGWKQFQDMPPQDLGKDEIAEEREHMYAAWVTTLLPLRHGKFKLEPLGKVKVGDRDAVGVRVSHEGHRDVNLFFDAGDGLLVKSEHRIKNLMQGDREETQEEHFSDYKTFDGLKRPTRARIYRDGKLYVEVEYTTVQASERLPEGTFSRP